ncbi:MAG: ABC transporter permease, partial [Actinomycetia bacterium]|nr:ABC transporter permease [Actinomycetes bacterium]
MIAIFLRRLVARLVTMSVIATILVFVAIEVSIPGGYRAVVLPNGVNRANPRDLAVVDHFHLDDHVLVRWAHWVIDAFQGDLGRTARGGTSVVEVITHRLPISIELALAGMLLAVVIGIPLGVLAAVNDRRPLGSFISVPLSVAQSVPVFMSATLGIWLFALELGWVRASGWTRISDSITGNL